MTTHTPGPWGSSGTAGHETHGQYAVYHLGTGKDIAIVYDGKANARLIAAAPELLKALVEASDALTELDPLGKHHNAVLIDNAIAKVKGQP